MVQYRRNRTAGATYFFTVTLADRRARMLTNHIRELRTAFAATRERFPFDTIATVVLPDHLHAIWCLPLDDADYSRRWQSIKSNFTRALVKKGVLLNRKPGGGYRLWQSHYWEHTIRDNRDLRHHIEYIWFNPVKHGHAATVAEWPFSSFHREVKRGVVPTDWGGKRAPELAHGYGE
ncbi:MAG TPA: transposase [Gammaproteobacteria bacterium]|nr:transposase [Gammaproteobacteria bacterium]